MENIRIKPIIITTVAVITLLIAWFVVDSINKSGKVPITIKVAPSDSIVTIDNKVSSSGNVYIYPGIHTFKATRTSFTDYSITVKIDNSSSNSPIILLPSPDSEEAKKFLTDNPNVQAAREFLGGERANIEGENLLKTNPIISILPFIDREYRIDYGPSQLHPNDKLAISITITSTSEASQQDALDLLKFKGYDTSKLELIYKRFPGY